MMSNISASFTKSRPKKMSTRLFLAEDDLILADALKTSLCQADFQVDCVNDGALALQILLHNDYDVVVLDIGLPNMDGLTVLRNIRQHKPSLPILISYNFV